MRTHTDWEHYERMIARLVADQWSIGLCVTPNARVTGVISGRRRQIDVLIENRHDTDNSRRIVVDAKRKQRKIDVTDVEAFRGLMEDVGATHGFLVCPSGHTKSAERRAQAAVGLCILPLDHLTGFDPQAWPSCRVPECQYGKVFWDGYPEVWIDLKRLDSQGKSEPIRKSFQHCVGKCDRCGRFHVQCHTCGQILSIPEDDTGDLGHQCACQPPWFWLASIEVDAVGRKSAELHLIMGFGKHRTVNRRSL